ncbi:MAG: metallophosphoesterase [Bacteroidetes bacterium]|nr:MAG: metallophosphoesterase [Bacteroidota bacterium]
MFREFTLLFILTGQVYLYRRFRRFLTGYDRVPRWIEAAVLPVFILFNLPLAVLYFYFWKLTAAPEWAVTVLMPFFAWHLATLFLYIVLGSAGIIGKAGRLVLKLLQRHPVINQRIVSMRHSERFQQFDRSRRGFLRKSAMGLSVYSFAGAAAGIAGEDDLDIIRTSAVIRGLPSAFKGFTIGVMSDIHSSVFMNRDDMLRYVRRMNGLGADLLVVTGDMVNSQTDEVYPFAEAFSELRAPYGVYGCLGNHDFFTKDVERVAKEVDGCGVRLLRNDAADVVKDGAHLALLGVDDIGRNTDPNRYLDAAVSAARAGVPRILLCHKPYFLPDASARNIDLMLSGHTHGGQIVFGTVDRTPISLAALASKYVAGWYEHGGTRLYVNKGIGSVGVPFRINCPPELTLITLT